MGNGIQFLDIIFFALIAAFLVLRLRNVLGRRDGHQGDQKDPRDPFNLVQPPQAENENVVQLPERDDTGAFEELVNPANRDEVEAEVQDPLAVGLTQIMRADQKFDAEEFLVGARTAFEMIIGGFASGDTEMLQALLSREVYGNFAEAIAKREDADETLETLISAIRVSEMVEAYMEGATACITVKFVSDQTKVTRNIEGKIIDGDQQESVEVTDFWTFAHNMRSRDPNWTLVATGSLD